MQLNQATVPWNVARSPFIPYPGQNSPWSIVKPLQLRAKVRAKRAFLDWLDQQNPELVQRAEEMATRSVAGTAVGNALVRAPNNGNLGYTPLIPRFSQDMNIRQRVMSQQMGQATPPITPDTDTEAKAESSWLDKIIDAASSIAPAYLQFEQQKKILDMQVERAKRGLPPLESAYIAPTVRVQAEVTPEMMTEARAGITEGLQNLALPLLAVGGIALLMMGGRRRRR